MAQQIPANAAVVFVDTTTNKIILLPSAASNPGRQITIKDRIGSAATNPILISSQTQDRIENTLSSLYIRKNFGAYTFTSRSTIWHLTEVISNEGSEFINLPAISSLSLQSTVTGIQNYAVTSTQLISSVTSLQASGGGGGGGAGSVTSTQLISSVTGLQSGGTGGGITTANLTSTVTNLGNIYLSAPLVLMGISSAGVVASTMYASNGYFANLTFSTAIGGLVTLSTINFSGNPGFITFNDFQPMSLSTQIVYTSSLFTQTLQVNSISTSDVQFSTLTASGGPSYIFTGDIQLNSVSTQIIYTSTLAVQNLQANIISTGNFVASNIIFSTLQVTNSFIALNDISPNTLSTQIVYASTLNYLNQFGINANISNIQFSTMTSFTGAASFINLTDIQPNSVSTQYIFTSSITTNTLNVSTINTSNFTGTVFTGSSLTFSTLQIQTPNSFMTVSDFQPNTLSTQIVYTSSLTYINQSGLNANITNIQFSTMTSFTGAQGLISFTDIQPNSLSTQYIYTSSITAINLNATTIVTSNFTGTVFNGSSFVFSSLQIVNPSSFTSFTDIQPTSVSTQLIYTSTLMALNEFVTNAQIDFLGVSTMSVSSLTMQTNQGFITATDIQPTNISTQALLVSSIQTIFLAGTNVTGSNFTFSTITFPNLGFLDFQDVRTTTLSTQILYTSTLVSPFYNFTSSVTANSYQVGISSQQNKISFYGWNSNYVNTVIVEQSTSATTQELLIFRGSSISDQIRLQTTGQILFETGVSGRVYPATPQQLTPSMILTTSNTVGINTSNPTTTLDVIGSFRATQYVSTTALTISSLNINGINITADQWRGSTNYLSAGTAVVNTITAGSVYGTFIGDGSQLTGIYPGGQQFAPAFGSTIAMSTGVLRSGGLYLGVLYV